MLLRAAFAPAVALAVLVAVATTPLACSSFEGEDRPPAASDGGDLADGSDSPATCVAVATPEGSERPETRCGLACPRDVPWSAVDAFTVASGFVYLVDGETKNLYERNPPTDRQLNTSSFVPPTTVLQVDEAHVYGSLGGTHWRVEIDADGSEPVSLSEKDGVLAVGEQHLFFAKPDVVVRMLKDQSAASIISFTSPGAGSLIAPAGRGAVWVSADDVSEKRAIYFAESNAPRKIAVANDIVALAGDGSHAYWLQNGHGVLRASLAGGAVETVANDSAALYRIAVTTRDVYWVTQRGSPKLAVLRVSKCGGIPEVVIDDLVATSGLGANEDYLYVNEVGRLHRVRQR